MLLARDLIIGRQDFLAATQSLTPADAARRPQPEAWSVLEIIEHVILAEERCHDWLATAPTARPRRDRDNEFRLFTTIRSRLTPVAAPEVYRPTGRYTDLPAALKAFESIRARNIQLVTELGDAIISRAIQHPRFGKLNGAELVRLIDGHARRHADQIRETRAALVTAPTPKPKPARTKQTTSFRRDEPDLPHTFATTTTLIEEHLQDAHLADAQHPDLRLDTLHFEGCLLERVQLTGAQLGALIAKDVRFVDCDLANLRAHRCSLTRVEFINCRLTGLRTTALDCHDVLIRNADLQFAQFAGGTFRNSEFDGCNATDIDLRDTGLTGCQLRDCDLTRADIQGATLRDTDLRGSTLAELQANAPDVRGAIVDPAQALALAHLLGLQIR